MRDARPFGIAMRDEASEGFAHGVADVEAAARAAVMPFRPPPRVPLQLVARIESAARDQALRQAESHRRAVRPLPRKGQILLGFAGRW